MRRWPLMLAMIAAVFAGAVIASPVQAQNYPWCAQYSGNMGGAMNCGFVSFDQCMATVRGMGGFCTQNNTYQPPPGPHPQRHYPY
jgi:hypothetical protein